MAADRKPPGRPGCTAQVLCQINGLDKAAVSRSLKLLEAGGTIAVAAGEHGARASGAQDAHGDFRHDAEHPLAAVSRPSQS